MAQYVFVDERPQEDKKELKIHIFNSTTKEKKQEKDRICYICGTTESPLWRNGQAGKSTLCNACGIRYKSMLRNEKQIPIVEQPQPVSVQSLLNPATDKNDSHTAHEHEDPRKNK